MTGLYEACKTGCYRGSQDKVPRDMPSRRSAIAHISVQGRFMCALESLLRSSVHYG